MPQLMRTSNPALNDQAFRGAGIAIGEPMTLQGTVNKTGVLLLCVIATAAWTWNIFMHSHSQESALSLAVVGGIGGFIFALITIFKKTWAPVTAPIYALLEGLVLGGISAMFELRFPGIAIQAVSLTFGTLVVLLLAYRSGLIPVTEKFKNGSGSRNRRYRALLPGFDSSRLFWSSLHHHQRRRPHWDSLQRF